MNKTINYLTEYSLPKYRWNDLERIIFLLIQNGITKDSEIVQCIALSFKKQYSAKEIYFAFDRVTHTLLGDFDDKQ